MELDLISSFQGRSQRGDDLRKSFRPLGIADEQQASEQSILSECRRIVEEGGMGKETERSAEMRRVLEEFKAGGLSRREFCQQRSIPLTTFDYWRRERGVKPRKQARRPQMVAVRAINTEPAPQFTLSLANVRGIESSWLLPISWRV